MSPVDLLREEHQQAGHEGKHGKQAAQDGLDEHDAHVAPDAELHEHHGNHAGNGGQGAGGDLRDGLGERDGNRVVRVEVLAFLRVAVAEDDGVVDGKGKLQNDRYGVGNVGNFSHKEVRALVDHGSGAEGHQQDRDFHVGLGGKQEDAYDDDHSNQHNDIHFRVEEVGFGAADGAGYVEVVACKALFELRHSGLADLIAFFALEGHIEEGGGKAVVFADVLGSERHVAVLVKKGGG
jgi:hypothetical protein